MGIFGEERVYPSEVPGPADLFSKKSDCCELVAIMRGMIDDEEEGRKTYLKMKSELKPLGKDPVVEFFQEILDDIAKDEEKHARYLKVISDAVSNFCKCD